MEHHRIARTTRRTVLASIAATLAPGPLVAQAQQRDGMRRLGVLDSDPASDPEGKARATALARGLGALNWREGGDLRIDWRGAGGDPALFERYAAELVTFGPDVLLAGGSLSIEALRRHASTIPIVFAVVADPVGQGFVASLARPGGTITGFSSYDSSIAGKWLQMLTQITPPVGHVAVLFNPETAPFSGLMLRTIEEAAPSFAVEVRPAPCHDNAEIEAVTAGLAREKHGGLLVLPGNFGDIHRDAIVALAATHRLPAIYANGSIVVSGGLISYSVDNNDLFRRAADYVDRILKGAKPGDLPVQRPDKFELVINLKTAKALGLTIPTTLLATADEVIE